jgi:hypothetical protein
MTVLFGRLKITPQEYDDSLVEVQNRENEDAGTLLCLTPPSDPITPSSSMLANDGFRSLVSDGLQVVEIAVWPTECISLAPLESHCAAFAETLTLTYNGRPSYSAAVA